MSNFKKFVKSWYKTGIAVILSVTISFIVFSIVQFPAVDGESMLPTYYDNEHIVIVKTHNVKRNDVAVVWCSEINDYIVKRVIGIGGDIIEIKQGGLYRNGVKLYESYINEQNWISEDVNIRVELKEDEFFVMGDNRNHSNDSRVFGTFSKENIIGRVCGEFWF